MCWRAALLVFCLAFVPWPARAAEPEPFNMGFYLPGIRDANLADVKVSVQLWAEEIGNYRGFRARTFTYDDMQHLHQDAMAGRIHIVVAPGMELAEFFAPGELKDGFAGVKAGEIGGLALVVGKTAGIRAFADLKGRRVVKLSEDRLSDVYLETQCQNAFKGGCRDFLDLSTEKRGISVLHRVFFGQAAAALVPLDSLHTALALNPQIAGRVRSLQEWRLRATTFGMIPAHTAPDYRARVLDAAMQVSGTVRGRQMLDLFKTERMLPVTEVDLQPFWRLARDYKNLIDKKATKRK